MTPLLPPAPSPADAPPPPPAAETASTADAAPAPAEARHVSPWTTRQKIARVLWWFVQATAWRWSWHTWYGYRRWVLRRFGAKVHPTARLRPSVRLECPWNLRIGANSTVGDRANLYALGVITLGERVTVSQQSHLCAGTHDFTRPDFPLVRPPITLHDDVWIAADAFVGPGVTVGRAAILGARGCAFKDLAPHTVHGGNPARPLGPRPSA